MGEAIRMQKLIAMGKSPDTGSSGKKTSSAIGTAKGTKNIPAFKKK